MGKFINLTGERYGKLLVLSRAANTNGHRTTWLCECDCGEKINVLGEKLKYGSFDSCGCTKSLSRVIDETGNRYGKLTVISRGKNSGKQTKWVCRCDCGSDVSVYGTSLRSGHTKSCGCLKFVDDTGKRYGKLTVIKLVDHNRYRKSRWLCKCDCGSEVVVEATNLHTGNTKSCGCLWREKICLDDGESSFNRMLSSMKHGAKVRGYDWALTDKQVREITSLNCHYCGCEPANRILNKCSTGDWVYNGLDRVDNAIGYRIDNVVPCCADCNIAKHARSYDDFMEWIGKVYHNLIGVEYAKDNFMPLVDVPDGSLRSRA